MRGSVGQARQQAFELHLGALDALVQALGVVLRRGQLLAQVVVIGAQSLAQADELRDLGFEGVELRVHARTMLQICFSVKKQALLLQVVPDHAAAQEVGVAKGISGILFSPRWCPRGVFAARVKRETGVEVHRAWITCAAPATVSAVRLHRMPLRSQSPWEGDAATWSETDRSCSGDAPARIPAHGSVSPFETAVGRLRAAIVGASALRPASF